MPRTHLRKRIHGSAALYPWKHMKKHSYPSVVVAALSLAVFPLQAQEAEKAAPSPEQVPAPREREMRQDAQPKERIRENRRNQPDMAPPVPHQAPIQEAQKQPWRIGLLVEPVDPALRAHLTIPENTGVVISQIVPGSPASQAGLVKNDIITAANGKPVKELDALRQQVEQSAQQSSPLRIAIIRKGKREDVVITPPTPMRPEARMLPPGGRVTPPAPSNRINDAMQPLVLRMTEQHKKLAEKIERQQQELEELRKELRQLRKEIKEQNQKEN